MQGSVFRDLGELSWDCEGTWACRHVAACEAREWKAGGVEEGYPFVEDTTYSIQEEDTLHNCQIALLSHRKHSPHNSRARYPYLDAFEVAFAEEFGEALG